MQNSEISWTHGTFNIVWGCIKVSPGCEHCYAETLAKRYGYNVWGPAKTTERRTMSDNYWHQPIRWNAAATKSGERMRVFCGSMSDVFENHPTNEQARARLWPLIEQTPMIDWLLLTKRPENMYDMLPAAWRANPRHNVWLGTSTEDQTRYDQRIGKLLGTPAAVHFLSIEPMLGAIDMRGYRPAWVICGGESGHGARPMHPDWARSLRNQCQSHGIAFHFKQHGEYVGETDAAPEARVRPSLFCAGGEASTVTLYQAGKHAAGRLLDGRTWDELPETPASPDGRG